MTKITEDNVDEISIDALVSHEEDGDRSFYLVNKIIGKLIDEDYQVQATAIILNEGKAGELNGNTNLTPNDWEFSTTAKRTIQRSDLVREWHYYPNVTKS